MVDTRLILIEGIPGSGKTCLAQRLAFHLNAIAIPARWYYECEVPHPIHDNAVMNTCRDQGCWNSEWFRQSLENWRKLPDLLRTTDAVIILESAFLQNTVLPLFLMETDFAAIDHHLQTITSIIRESNPHLIRLYQEDIEKALQTTCTRREGWWLDWVVETTQRTPWGKNHAATDPRQFILALYDHYTKTLNALLDRCPLTKLSIENSDGIWSDHYAQVARFLGLSDPTLAHPHPQHPEEYSGQYREILSKHTWEITIKDGGLLVTETPPFRLLQRSRDIFEVQGMCLELHFIRNNQGTVESLTCQGRLEDPTIGTHWRKLP